MAKITTGTFTHWELTNTEILAGSILTTDQKNILQNELAQIAENKLNLDFDPLNPTKFAQDEAFLKGQMSIIRVMLLRSDESEIAYKNQAALQNS
jgi:hypothetical protein